MIDAVLLSIIVPLSHTSPNGPATCDGGSGYYDDVHQICEGYIPSDPQPGYGRFCDGDNYLDEAHDVCAPYEPAYPPPMYPNY